MPEFDDPDEVTRLLQEAKRPKQSPYLISWKQLEHDFPDIADLDRMFVRDIPQLLAGAGLQVVRKKAPSAESPAQQPIPA
jgi:hypothetical protein